MNELLVVSLIMFLISASLLAAWLDHKHNWRLVDWFSGRCSNPFIGLPKQTATQQLTEKDAKIEELTKRVQVLEKIVTEPAYELNKKLNNL